MEDLRAEAVEKGDRLKATLAEVSRLSIQVENFCNQLDLSKIQCAKMDIRIVTAE